MYRQIPDCRCPHVPRRRRQSGPRPRPPLGATTTRLSATTRTTPRATRSTRPLPSLPRRSTRAGDPFDPPPPLPPKTFHPAFPNNCDPAGLEISTTSAPVSFLDEVLSATNPFGTHRPLPPPPPPNYNVPQLQVKTVNGVLPSKQVQSESQC